MVTRYVIERLALGSAAKFGLALGVLGSLLPACFTAILSRQAVTFLHQSLQAATQAKFSVLGQNITLNLVDLMHLTPALQALGNLDALGWLLPVVVFAGCALFGGLAIAATVLLGAIGFNALAAITGGLEFQATERAPRPRPTVSRVSAETPPVLPSSKYPGGVA